MPEDNGPGERFTVKTGLLGAKIRSAPRQDADEVKTLIPGEVVIKVAESAEAGWWQVLLAEDPPESEDQRFVMAELLMPAAAEEEADPKAINLPEFAAILTLNARRYGTNRMLLAGVAWCESRFKNAVNAASQATGPFQFLPGTWASLVKAHGEEAEVGEDQIRDITAQARLAAISFAIYAKELKNFLSRDTTAVEQYFAHFLGWPAARFVLAEDLDQPIDQPLREFYATTSQGAGFADTILAQNPQLKDKQSGKVKTTRQVLATMAETLDKGLREAATLFGQALPNDQPTAAEAIGQPDAAPPTDFGAFVARLGLRHFGADELLAGIGQSGNGMPKREIWGNIVPTILVLDELREHLGVAISIGSCYRAPSFNGAIGGAELSQHMAFRAIDFVVAGRDSSAVADLLRSWRGRTFRAPPELVQTDVPVAAGIIPLTKLKFETVGGERRFVFAGGIGKYPRFVHLDTRGTDVNWDKMN